MYYMCIAELKSSQSQSEGPEEGLVIPLLLQNKPPAVEDQETGELPDLHLRPDTVRRYSRRPKTFTKLLIERCFNGVQMSQCSVFLHCSLLRFLMFNHLLLENKLQVCSLC